MAVCSCANNRSHIKECSIINSQPQTMALDCLSQQSAHPVIGSEAPVKQSAEQYLSNPEQNWQHGDGTQGLQAVIKAAEVQGLQGLQAQMF